MNMTELFNSTTTAEPDVARQPKTIQGPLLGLLIAATLLAKASQAKPYLLGYNQSPWLPFRPLYNYLPSLWYPPPGNQYPTTIPPQILPPPLNQQQIIHIHDPPTTSELPDDVNKHYEVASSNINTSEGNEYATDESASLQTQGYDVGVQSASVENYKMESDNDAESSNRSYSIISLNVTELNKFLDQKFNFSEETNTLKLSSQPRSQIIYVNSNQTEAGGNNEIDLLPDYSDQNKRSRRTPQKSGNRKGSVRRPSDYDDRLRNRRRPVRRRTTTPNYDDYSILDRQANRKKRRPLRNRNKGNRRPVNREPDYYDSAYRDDYYDEDYDVFARQGNGGDEESTESSTTEGTSSIPTTAPQNNHTGYTYGPPNTAYGPPGYNTGYGYSNGNDQISITYAPPSAPNRDALAPILDAFYNQYSKSSVLRRLQELLQPNNFYNNQQYDYQDTL